MKKPPLSRLPGLNERNVRNDRGGNNAPLPTDGRVLEDSAVDDRDINDRESDEEASEDRPEQEAIAQDGVDDGEWAAKLLRIHVEE